MGMTGWLECSLSPGMFPSEYAVEIDTCHAGRVSFFAYDYMVNERDHLVRVDLLAQCDTASVVRLPTYPFEVSSRVVRVPRASLRVD